MESLTRNEDLTQDERQEKVDIYVAKHPNAVVDRDKAEEMATASKHHEEVVTELGKAVRGAMVGGREDRQIGETGFQVSNLIEGNNSQNGNMSVEFALNEARVEREKADVAAANAGRQYDVVNAAERLMRGEQLEGDTPSPR